MVMLIIEQLWQIYFAPEFLMTELMQLQAQFQLQDCHNLQDLPQQLAAQVVKE